MRYPVPWVTQYASPSLIEAIAYHGHPRGDDPRWRESGAPDQAKPKDKDQYNFTDPQSRIMPGANGMTQGYNAQAAVESLQASVEESLP